ncbi:16S rRNA (guanine1207-N2)-methyltransferase [Microbacterium keratanolyticum]|uniref:16S RNA G1207 methylase RsmC n=1 Tax=Microbacterium keratanolyticum TaxID=67574 RepID=A0A9W6HPX7_9MICO|nr:methyltransferase [Microbacterium keratanolyticum]MBM7468670.1 16S rRNA (guanine1207-N2)-methyltransferase [Microbacterium keratanolyticum]GLK00746.1 16S RNA G1207 methylase RsmC [Microbacterium keratanolyticum]
MSDFPYSRLRRFPDVEAENLQAWDATDELLVAEALRADAPGARIAVIGDEYGAITLALAAAGLRGIRVHQDLATGRRALANNARALLSADAVSGTGRVEGGHADGVADLPREDTAFTSHELGPELLSGARLVLLQLPKALAELEEIADAIARWAAPDVVVIAGGRVKHMTLGQNEVLGRFFENVQAQRAQRKSRLVIAAGPRPVAGTPPFPVVETHEGLTLVAHGGAFAGARLDIGTRVLLDALALGRSQLLQNGVEKAETARNGGFAEDSGGVSARTVVDLGCGTGALAVSYALAHPEVQVLATDRSAAAVASARETVRANGVEDRVTVTHDDAGSEIAAASVDIVLLNPPFHLGASVHTGAATRLFEASARILRPGGELWTVFNSSLAYRGELTRLIGETEQILRTPKFTVTRSIRRS